MLFRYKEKNMKILQILWKKGNNSKTGIQNYFKISGQVDLVLLIIFTPARFFISVTVFELFGKFCNFTPVFYYSNIGHVFHSTGTKRK
jgi:hypothetical protein